jgi:peptidoglycan lytic transglycosylase
MNSPPRVQFVLLALAVIVIAIALALISEPIKPALIASSHPSTAIAASPPPTSPANAANDKRSRDVPTTLSPAPPTSTYTSPSLEALPPPTPQPVSSASYQQGMVLRRDGDYVHAEESFRVALEEKPDPASAHEIIFRLGESAWLAGDYQSAVTAFTQMLAENENDSLASRAHYFLADIFSQTKSYSQAIEHLRAYRAETRTLMGEIDAQIGDLYLAAGDYSLAVAQYDVALGDQSLTLAQRVDLLERVADVETKLAHPDLAVARLGQAFKLAPDNETRADVEYRWGQALDAAQEGTAAVSHWRHALATYPDQDGAYQSLVELLNRQQAVDDYQRGLTDYYAKSYGPSIMSFNRYITANPKNSTSARYFIGLAYLEDGQPTLAVQSFDTLLRNFPGDSHSADATYNKAVAYSRAGDTANAVAAYDHFVEVYPHDGRADDALWTAAQLLDKAGRAEQARTEYDKLASNYPSSAYTPQAIFDVGLDYYLSQDYVNSESRWESVAKLFPNTTDGARGLFWLGKLARTRGDTVASQRYLKQAAEQPRSYYGWRALDLLGPGQSDPSYDIASYLMNTQSNNQAEFEQWLARLTGTSPVSSQLGADVLKDFHFRRGLELAQLDRAAEARVEFQKVNNLFRSNANSLYALAVYYQENNYFDLSIDAAQRIQALSGVSSEEQLPRYLRAMIYPTYYADLIVPYAQRNGIDPALLFALVRQESRYNPLSASWVSATGLTQVMPQTGSGIARELGVLSFAQADLLRPYVSVRFGAYYLGQQLKSFGGNILYALGGYNGGPGNAKKWVRPDVDLGVEAISLAETSVYVRTVYSQYNEYVEIYQSRRP